MNVTPTNPNAPTSPPPRSEWNPSIDPHLPATYDATNFVEGKAKCKMELQVGSACGGGGGVVWVGVAARVRMCACACAHVRMWVWGYWVHVEVAYRSAVLTQSTQPLKPTALTPGRPERVTPINLPATSFVRPGS